MAWLYIAVAIVAGGCWGIVQKMALRDSSPLMVTVVSAYVYSIIGPAVFLYMKGAGKSVSWSMSSILWVCLACVLVTVKAFAFSSAVQQAPVGLTVGLTGAYPLLTFALSALVLGEAVTLQRLVGVAVVSIGILVLSW